MHCTIDFDIRSLTALENWMNSTPNHTFEIHRIIGVWVVYVKSYNSIIFAVSDVSLRGCFKAALTFIQIEGIVK